MFQLKSDSQPTSKKGKCIDWFVLLPTVFSVGGSDYCYVSVGAYMPWKITKSVDAELLKGSN